MNFLCLFWFIEIAVDSIEILVYKIYLKRYLGRKIENLSLVMRVSDVSRIFNPKFSNTEAFIMVLTIFEAQSNSSFEPFICQISKY